MTTKNAHTQVAMDLFQKLLQQGEDDRQADVFGSLDAEEPEPTTSCAADADADEVACEPSLAESLSTLVDRLRTEVDKLGKGKSVLPADGCVLLRPGKPSESSEIYARINRDTGLSLEGVLKVLRKSCGSVGSARWLHELSRATSVGGVLYVERFQLKKTPRTGSLAKFLCHEAACRQWPPAIVDMIRFIDEALPDSSQNEAALNAMLPWLVLLCTCQGEPKSSVLIEAFIDALALVTSRTRACPQETLEFLTSACAAAGIDPAVRLHGLAGVQAPGGFHVFASQSPLEGRDMNENQLLASFKPLTEPMELKKMPADLGAVEAELNARAPHARDISRYVLSLLEAQRRRGTEYTKLPPILLHGGPGTGKDDYWDHLCKLLGLPYRVHQMGGGSDNRELEGTSRGWGTAFPSLIANHIRESNVANSVLGIGEIEKYNAGGHNGDSQATLLAMLEPRTAARWRDVGLGVDLDLSPVIFLATANSLKGVPRPLQSRFTILRMPEPSSDDYYAITRSILGDIAHRRGLDSLAEPDAFEWEALEMAFKLKPDLRVLVRILERMVDERETGERRPKH